MVVEVDLRELQEKAKIEKFYGEALIKFEAGEIKLIELTQKFKPADFSRMVLVQIAI
jgi:hypothetical protein